MKPLHRLFPNYVKQIVFVFLAIFFVILLIARLTEPSLVKGNMLLKEITIFTVIGGLLAVILSREKIEDERVMQLRLQSFAFAFVFGIGYTLLSRLGILGDDGYTHSSLGLMFLLELSYLGYFTLLKYRS